jgi:hypothetical protein
VGTTYLRWDCRPTVSVAASGLMFTHVFKDRGSLAALDPSWYAGMKSLRHNWIAGRSTGRSGSEYLGTPSSARALPCEPDIARRQSYAGD